MSSRAHTDAARLRRLKRIGHRIGLTILSNPKPAGGYMLSDDTTRTVLLGNKPVPYSGNLDEIEAYLESRAEAES